MKHFAKLIGLGLLASTSLTAMARADVTPEAVIMHYADVAEAKYEDSLTTAKALDAAIEAFLADPTEEKARGCQDRMACRPRALPAVRSLPLWQCHRR